MDTNNENTITDTAPTATPTDAERNITRRHVQRQGNWARRRLAKAKDNAEG